jgi:tagatose 6-phosphate kinase
MGLPTDAYATLVGIVRAAGVPALLDSSGPALLAGLAGGPSLVKPNLAELRAVTPGMTAGVDNEVVLRTRALLDRGAQAVVASLGRDGMVAVTLQGAWHARLPMGTTVSGNPTGAGDAAVAALAAGATANLPWADRLRSAVALSAAAVAHPLAGSVDPNTYQDLLATVQVTTPNNGHVAGRKAS